MFPTSSSFLVRRQETICCLIGFGIGVGCCLLYRWISNLFTPPKSIQTRDVRDEQKKNDGKLRFFSLGSN